MKNVPAPLRDHSSAGSRRESVEERVAREDLVMFVNAGFACSGQREFYSDASGQAVSIDFLHRYILGNYRRLYARTLAAGVNHFNQGHIVLNLLATGAETPPADRAEENRLITAAVRRLPPHRVFRLFEALRDRRINNRRTRAVIRGYLASRRNSAFDAVKYRSRLRVAATHAHLRLPDEIGDFLFHGWKKRRFSTEILETFRQAHFSKEAMYRLPYSIAEGLAARAGVDRDEFLAGIAPRMTANEKLRLQRRAGAAKVDLDVDLGRASLTRLAVFVSALPLDERRGRALELSAALQASAARAFRRGRYPMGRVAAVLDRSYSSSGTSEKRRRPLAVAMATSYLLREAAAEFRAFWTPALADGESLFATPFGQTDLAGPLIEALRWQPDTVVIVSDGYENAPAGATAHVVKALRERVPGGRGVSIVHLNPVFDAEDYAPRALGPGIPTVGIRDAEDVLTMLGFARFAEGTAPIQELEAYLDGRIATFLAGADDAEGRR